VFEPDVLPGIVQANQLSLIDGRYITALTAVAKNTGVGQVFRKRIAAVFAADDVVYLGPKGGVVFVDQAVFAPAVRAEGDIAAQRQDDVTGHWRESGVRGLWPF